VRIFSFLFLLFFCLTSLEAKPEQAGALIFAPHPADETLGCAATILKAVHKGQQVKIVFLTNGDGSTQGAAVFFKKTPQELTAEDYLVLGNRRQEEAICAANKLGLKEQDLIFLSYPDNGLAPLWLEEDNANSSSASKGISDNYASETTKKAQSPYQRTYQRARLGYSHKNLFEDIKEILMQYRPEKIYAPSALDSDTDFVATANFLNQSLDELRSESDSNWISSLRVFYYIINTKIDLSEQQNYGEDTAEFKNQKIEAWKNYEASLNPREGAIISQKLSNDLELFHEVPNQKERYLHAVYDEWKFVSGTLKKYGYNLNFAPVVDVAGDINDRQVDLVKKGRIFSDNPRIVFQLASKMAEAMNTQGIIPVLKHFPGLGLSDRDTHKRLPKLQRSSEIAYEIGLLPYREMIKKGVPFWVMTSHAIYPYLDDKPASLSYKIQTQLLRNQLGFKGIVISDEFLNMQAVEEYALEKGMQKPFIGEIVAMAFEAGTDISIIYPRPEKAEEVVSCVTEAVKKAVKEKRLSQQQIDNSVIRILKEKERIFNKPLRHILKNMSLEEKIAQKIIIDAYDNYPLFAKYCLGGIEARDAKIIEQLQKEAKVPLFIAGQHEGGRVIEGRLNICTQSAYLTGREFERSLKQTPIQKSTLMPLSNTDSVEATEEAFFDFSQLDKAQQENIINILSSSVDEQIKFYKDLKQGTQPLYNPNNNVALEIDLSDPQTIRIKAFRDLPLKWLCNFFDRNTALCAYKVLKESFQKWKDGENINQPAMDRANNDYSERMVHRLNRLKELIKDAQNRPNQRQIRMLCLAVHPDDEDAEALSFFKKKFNSQTCILLATRGEGGENLIGPQLYEELGVLRTEEMEKAASILGVDKVYYLGKKDFGYCFDPEEAFNRWDRNDTLYKLVYFYRLIKPDIIITKHNPTDGHCQHRAFVILAAQAFDLASDPKVYPEMIEGGLSVWQPMRFYQRRTASAAEEGCSLSEIVINQDEYGHLDNQTYSQIAAEALKQHESQRYATCSLTKRGKISFDLVKSAGKTEIDLKQDVLPKKGQPVASGIPGIKIAAGLRVGLIEEHSSNFFIALKTLGCDVKRLERKFIGEGNLSEFDTILVSKGIFDILSAVKDAKERLLEFVKVGGNLAVFLEDKVVDTLRLVPYPLKISFNAITNGNSPVIILSPEQPLFNFPNKILPADFDGWRQDRGLFFPSQHSEGYTELLDCQKNETESVRTGYLVAGYGKGSYILTTFSWFRQLRELHFGACKNLANIISYSSVKR
jgi:LmbE family N-acetylglucosaminyl deacetylase